MVGGDEEEEEEEDAFKMTVSAMEEDWSSLALVMDEHDCACDGDVGAVLVVVVSV